MKTITFNREAAVRISKHAWNVYPLCAFGYLLGIKDERHIIAALPYSKSQQWNNHDDYWHNIEKGLPLAENLAKIWQLSVVGLYSSGDYLRDIVYEINNKANLEKPKTLSKTMLAIKANFQTLCCPACSYFDLYADNQLLDHGADWFIPKGKRSHPYFYQKRIYQDWLKTVGQIDYSNR